MTVARMLVQQGADIEGLYDLRETPLRYAIRARSFPLIAMFLQCGADIEAPNKDTGEAPLQEADRAGEMDICQILLEYGADPKLVQNPAVKTLHHRIRQANEAQVECISWRGAGVGKIDIDKYKETPLQHAVRGRYEDMYRLLMDQGGDIEAVTNTLETSLYYAVALGRSNFVRILLHRRANIEHADTTGRTPLYHAVQQGYTSTIELLIERGANIDTINKWGEAPLHDAARKGQEAMCILLIEKEANTEALN